MLYSHSGKHPENVAVYEGWSSTEMFVKLLQVFPVLPAGTTAKLAKRLPNTSKLDILENVTPATLKAAKNWGSIADYS